MEMNVFLLGQRHARKNLANSQKEVKHVNKEQCTVHLAFLRQYVNEVLIKLDSLMNQSQVSSQVRGTINATDKHNHAASCSG